MQADLHYYTTYLAAFAEGFSPPDAETIAMAAHYCDCSGDPGPLPSPFDSGSALQKTIGAVRALYHANDLASTTVVSTQAHRAAFDENRDLWAAFHFLPAHDPDFAPIYPYAWDFKDRSGEQGALSPGAELAQAHCSKLQNQAPCLVCLARPPSEAVRAQLLWRCFPNSPTVEALKQDTLSNMSAALQIQSVPGRELTALRSSGGKVLRVADPRTYALSLLGVRLHVLADTFSHAGCSAGVSRANLFGDIYIKAPGAARAGSSFFDRQTIDEADYVPLNFVLKSRSPLERRAVGHAYYGALPDLPGLSWRADSAGFAKTSVYRCNPIVYKCAVAAIRSWCRAARALMGSSQAESYSGESGDRATARSLLANHDFSAGVFEFPRNYLNLTSRNRDFYKPYSQQFHEFDGEQSEDSLYERCVAMYALVVQAHRTGTQRPEPRGLEALCHSDHDYLGGGPKLRPIHARARDMAEMLTHREQTLGLGRALASAGTARIEGRNRELNDWDEKTDNNTEYSIVRRLRVLYFEDHARLREVNAAAQHHVNWFAAEGSSGLNRDWG